MSYDDQKAKAIRHPVYIVELYLERCTRTYGVAPCFAGGVAPPIPVENFFGPTLGDNFSVPLGVSEITIEGVAGGAGGAGSCVDQDIAGAQKRKATGGGGGAGGYFSLTLPVQPGDFVEYEVGSGGVGGAADGPDGDQGGMGTDGERTRVRINGVVVAEVEGGKGGIGGIIIYNQLLFEAGVGGDGGAVVVDPGTSQPGEDGDDGAKVDGGLTWPPGPGRSDGGEAGWPYDDSGNGGYGGGDDEPAGSWANDDGEDGADGRLRVFYVIVTPPDPTSVRCFNTWKTCQYRVGYEASTEKPLRFTSEMIRGLQEEDDPPYWPTIRGLKTSPTTLDPGRSFGVRGSITIDLIDHPWNDLYTDPYRDTRAYDPEKNGTFWGKLIARAQFIEGRQIDILSGFLDDDGKYDPANFKRRTYFVDQVEKQSRDRVKITAKDPLKKADSDRSEAPATSNGALESDINETDTVLQLGAGEAQEYQDALTQQGQLWVRISDETMFVDSVDTVLDRLTVTRANLPSIYDQFLVEAENHDEGDVVQVCLYYEDLQIHLAVYDLLVTYAGIDPAYIDQAEWQAVADEFLVGYNVTRLITEPTSVRDHMNVFALHNLINWWDERDQLIKLDVLKTAPNGVLPTLDQQSNILADAQSARVDIKLRKNEYWFAYGNRNPIKDLDEISNYRAVYALVDSDAQSEEEYGDRRIQRIFSPWIPGDGRAIAVEIVGRLAPYYQDTKTILTVKTDVKDDDVWTGDTAFVFTDLAQNEFGAQRQYRGLILSVNEELTDAGIRHTYQLADYGVGRRTGFITPNEDPENPGQPFPDYADASNILRDNYGFISTNEPTPLMLNGDPPYLIV